MPCVADDDGRNCYREIVMTTPVPLCAFHRAQVALAIVPDLLRDHLVTAEASTAAPPLRYDLVNGARSVPVDQLLNGVHESIVYFITNGGRVKIGFTTNLKSRLGALTLRADSVLMTVGGGPDLERALHAQFAAYRNGDTEWFELSPEIFQYIVGRKETATPRPMRRTGAEPTRQTDEIKILDDVFNVISTDEKSIWNERVAVRLGALRPEVYAKWKGETVTAALKSHGVITGQVWALDDDGKDRNRRGIKRTDVALAITRRRRSAATTLRISAHDKEADPS